MAEIFDKKGTAGINIYNPDDPYYYDIDNRPIVNLLRNDIAINENIPKTIKLTIFQSPQRIFELPEEAEEINVYLNGILYNKESINHPYNSDYKKFEINDEVLPSVNDNDVLIVEYKRKIKASDINPQE